MYEFYDPRKTTSQPELSRSDSPLPLDPRETQSVRDQNDTPPRSQTPNDSDTEHFDIQTAVHWLATIILTARRQLSWPLWRGQ